MLPDGLLNIVLNDNDIVWADEHTKEKITLIVLNGIDELNFMSGLENDFLVAGKAQMLLLAYVKYALTNALDDFKTNYHFDIVSFINRAKVKKYVESQNADSN